MTSRPSCTAACRRMARTSELRLIQVRLPLAGPRWVPALRLRQWGKAIIVQSLVEDPAGPGTSHGTVQVPTDCRDGSTPRAAGDRGISTWLGRVISRVAPQTTTHAILGSHLVDHPLRTNAKRRLAPRTIGSLRQGTSKDAVSRRRERQSQRSARRPHWPERGLPALVE